MVGWFALNVPSGLSLYYFSNTVLTGATQVFLRKLGGAHVAAPRRAPAHASRLHRACCAERPLCFFDNIPGAALLGAGAKAADFDLGPLELGKARRSGTAVASSPDEVATSYSEAEGPSNEAEVEALAFSAAGQDTAAEAAAAAAAPAPPQVNRRCKRRRRELLEA
jgi:YidC/Oxa1 family membrane protein insertase